jgi:hypothetical protein
MMDASEFYLGEKYSVQWWVGALLRLRRTAREANYFTLRWESNLEFEFSKYFGLEGTSARAKKLVTALEIVQLLEATPEKRAERLKVSTDSAKYWRMVEKWNERIQGDIGDNRDRWDHYYIQALQHLRNELRISVGLPAIFPLYGDGLQDGPEPEESRVRELALRIRAWSNLSGDKKCHTKSFAKMLFNPGQRADPLEQELQTEIRALRKHYAPKVWSRLTSRYRAKPHDSQVG